MSKQTEALKLALEALEDTLSGDLTPYQAAKTITALVAAAERESWPAEMEAMERQVNILTDALVKAKSEEREACAKRLEAVGCDHCAAIIRARRNT